MFMLLKTEAKTVFLRGLTGLNLNRSSRRKRGMASNPLFIIPDFILHFPCELCYGNLRFEGNRKLPLER